MAFRKTAKAKFVRTVTASEWADVIAKTDAISGHGVRTASSSVTSEFTPDKFLLSHVTIVASVDTEPGEDADKLGRVFYGSHQIERRYPDYFVKLSTEDRVNNNGDCFERKVLLNSYETFIGGQNYCEHIQIPELSKGKIIDAAARDLGDTVYVDILVATDRKHTDLVADIEAGRMMTLSMGAVVAWTTCTKCGNVAIDETDLCTCVQYEKGNYFYDRRGNRRKIAELCGTFDPNNPKNTGVKFIEASWVRDPAFAGAVLRNILSVDALKDPGLAKKIQVAFEIGARRLSPDQMLRTASTLYAGIFDFGQATQEDGGSSQAPQQSKPETQAPEKSQEKKPEEKSKKDDIIDELADEFLDKARERARSKAFEKPPSSSELSTNDTLVQGQGLGQGSRMPTGATEASTGVIGSSVGASNTEGSDKNPLSAVTQKPVVAQGLVSDPVSAYDKFLKVYTATSLDRKAAKSVYSVLQHLQSGGWKHVAASGQFTGEQVLLAAAFLDSRGKTAAAYPLGSDGYAAVLAVGGTDRFQSPQDYLIACAQQLGRKVSSKEAEALIMKGKLLSLVARRRPANHLKECVCNEKA